MVLQIKMPNFLIVNKQKNRRKRRTKLIKIKRIFLVRLKGTKSFYKLPYVSGRRTTFFLQTPKYTCLNTNHLNAFKQHIKFGKKYKGFRIFPYIPKTKKPAEMRMGKGKGSRIASIIYPMRPGQTVLRIRIQTRSYRMFYKILRIAINKLPIKFRLRLLRK